MFSLQSLDPHHRPQVHLNNHLLLPNIGLLDVLFSVLMHPNLPSNFGVHPNVDVLAVNDVNERIAVIAVVAVVAVNEVNDVNERIAVIQTNVTNL